jgi:uncharacterized protein (TIGR04222 family)
VNLFDLRGPEFLRLYTWLATGLLVLAVLWRRVGERGSPPKLASLDAYSAAYLRGGAAEAMRVVALVLIDRQLLLRNNGTRLCAARGARERVRRPFERAVLEHFETSAEATSLFESQAVRVSAQGLESDLAQTGLMPNTLQKSLRVFIERGGLFVLGAVAATKLWVALSRGHVNVLYLLMVWIGGSWLIYRLTKSRRTATGNQVLTDLRALCAGLRGRSAQLQIGRGSYDFAMLLGAFGLGALSGASADLARKLFPGAYRKDGSAAGGDGSSSTSSCSSGCGSSCGSSSCGSSCGGGGCGGCGGD